MNHGINHNRLPKDKLKGFLDQNPRVLVSTRNLRFSAYREMRKIRDNPTAHICLETDEGEVYDRPSFLGDYEVVEDTFQVLGSPWQAGEGPLTEDENYILTNKTGKVRLVPGSYRVSEI